MKNVLLILLAIFSLTVVIAGGIKLVSMAYESTRICISIDDCMSKGMEEKMHFYSISPEHRAESKAEIEQKYFTAIQMRDYFQAANDLGGNTYGELEAAQHTVDVYYQKLHTNEKIENFERRFNEAHSAPGKFADKFFGKVKNSNLTLHTNKSR
jgi:hypothetical protein